MEVFIESPAYMRLNVHSKIWQSYTITIFLGLRFLDLGQTNNFKSGLLT